MLPAVDVLVRRGSEFVQMDKELPFSFPVWAIVVLTVIAVVYSVVSVMVEYTYMRLIPTLIMVESPQATLYDPIASTDLDGPLDDLDDTKKQPLEPELLLVKHKPVTSSFRSTLAHLRARAGRGSRLRGFTTYILTFTIVGYMTRVIGLLKFIPCRAILAPVIAEINAANFLLLWTHIVISAPTATRWYKRFAPLQTIGKILGPTALVALTKQTAIMVPAMLFMKLNQQLPTTPSEWSELSCQARSRLILQGFGVAALSFAFWILLVIPAKVTLTRVQASLLPEEEEPIVPFDRTFGGKTEPTGVLGMLDAWRTFDRDSRIRLLKAYFKAGAIQLALTLFFGALAMFTVVVALGQELVVLMDAIKSGDKNFKMVPA